MVEQSYVMMRYDIKKSTVLELNPGVEDGSLASVDPLSLDRELLSEPVVSVSLVSTGTVVGADPASVDSVSSVSSVSSDSVDPVTVSFEI